MVSFLAEAEEGEEAHPCLWFNKSVKECFETGL